MRLTTANLPEYVGGQTLLNEHSIWGIIPFLQKNFGGLCDCSLMSIATAIYYKCGRRIDIQEIYDSVEKYATYYFYRSSFGTLPFFIRSIYKKALQHWNLPETPCSAYFKNWFFTKQTMKALLDRDIPIILNMLHDGRDYYTTHSVLAVGYKEYADGTFMIEICDNWYRNSGYVDYDKMSFISSIVW